jgi:hypothetical protein
MELRIIATGWNGMDRLPALDSRRTQSEPAYALTTTSGLRRRSSETSA